MSDTPDRAITGLSPRGAAPDFSRLQRRNRVVVPEPAVVDVQHVEEPSRPPAVTSELPAPFLLAAAPTVVSKSAVTERERVTTYLDGRLRARAREAYRATSHLEGDKSWSDFVERAILAEVIRREAAHNDGRPYAGDETPLSPGRPLK
ncbi:MULTISPECIES: hypothetical protein [unclassified Frondihabitans]|jgi:hypothetical protein|uniref:ParB family protein n=1 Tax=unclassified Frondihabitans TaxID=2626248 RepID=UPI000F9BBE83|nr:MULTISPECIES: hypothetical protein [unclassified Frondihabitans]RPF02113.1 hypothetical protein EDF39_3434 [Frondihabitans sp. PhB161]